MMRTQIQLPDSLYREAKRVAAEREISFAEVVRRGLEYITKVYPPTEDSSSPWLPPTPHHLGEFLAPPEDWRLIAEERAGDDLR
ncbi:MAG: antitoxin [Acidobacteriota bacterium]